MRVIVCGGRTYDNEDAVEAEIVALVAEHGADITVVHGAAPGADSLAASAAVKLGLEREAHPADWSTYGRAAGPIRNQEMADGGADLCVAFPGGLGTADMVRRANAAGIPVRQVRDDGGRADDERHVE